MDSKGEKRTETDKNGQKKKQGDRNGQRLAKYSHV